MTAAGPPRGPRAGDTGREPGRLPPGRHGLSRAFVVQNQRERILSAVADVTSAAGYADMTVEGVIGCAGVSRRTFYEQFKNKEDAFLAAYDLVVSRLLGEIRRAYDGEDTFPRRLAAGLGALLDLLAREPAFARMCIVEVMAAGPDAVKRRNDAMAAFARMIEENARELGMTIQPSELTTETIVGGIYEVIYARVVRGEIRELPSVLPDLLYSALLPYAGTEAAAGEYERLAKTAAARS